MNISKFFTGPISVVGTKYYVIVEIRSGTLDSNSIDDLLELGLQICSWTDKRVVLKKVKEVE